MKIFIEHSFHSIRPPLRYLYCQLVEASLSIRLRQEKMYLLNSLAKAALGEGVRNACCNAHHLYPNIFKSCPASLFI